MDWNGMYSIFSSGTVRDCTFWAEPFSSRVRVPPVPYRCCLGDPFFGCFARFLFGSWPPSIGSYDAQVSLGVPTVFALSVHFPLYSPFAFPALLAFRLYFCFAECKPPIFVFAAPQIHNLPVPPGTFYLVYSHGRWAPFCLVSRRETVQGAGSLNSVPTNGSLVFFSFPPPHF